MRSWSLYAPEQNKDQDDHDDDAKSAAAVIAGAVERPAADAAEPAQQRDDEDDEDNRADRHGVYLVGSARRRAPSSGAVRRWMIRNHPANACSRIGFRALGRPKCAGNPLNNDIHKFRALMVNLKAFGNCKKRNNFAAI